MTRVAPSLVIALVISLCACASAGPRVNVLGVADAPSRSSGGDRQTVKVFLEVVNPTRLALQLSRLEYRFTAGSWFTIDGEVALSRAVPAGSTAVIEVPVSVSALRAGDEGASAPGGAVTYSLEGRIFALADRMERSWSVAARGELSAEAVAAVRSPEARTRIADRQR
jgi:hypothetical protein